jgi:hypothetical protein
MLISWDTYAEWNCNRKCHVNSDSIYKHVKSFRATCSLLRRTEPRGRHCVLPPYKTSVVQKPYEKVGEARLNFSNWYLHRLRDGEIDPTLVSFSGETWFKLTISRYLNPTNNMVPTLMHDAPLHDVTLGVWCAVSVRIISRGLWLSHSPDLNGYE